MWPWANKPPDSLAVRYKPQSPIIVGLHPHRRMLQTRDAASAPLFLLAVRKEQLDAFVDLVALYESFRHQSASVQINDRQVTPPSAFVNSPTGTASTSKPWCASSAAVRP